MKVPLKKQYQKSDLLVPAMVLAVGLFFVLTIRPGHVWGDDFSMYIRQAMNLADGTNYQDTGYLYNPVISGVGPRTYPPVFPLLLAPIYKIFGFDLTPMKVEVIFFFLAALVTVYFIYREKLSRLYLLAMLALVGFNPYYWEAKDNVQSDIPFFFFTCLAVLLVNRAPLPGQPLRLYLPFLTGLTFYLAYGSRTLGVLLVVSLVLLDLVRFHKIRLFTVISTVVFGLFFVAQQFLFKGDSSYFDTLKFDPLAILNNFWVYFVDTANFWEDGYTYLNFGLYALITLLALLGYVRQVRREISLAEIFLPLYTFVILVWPAFQVKRFFLPVFPFYLYYVLVGIAPVAAYLQSKNFLGKPAWWRKETIFTVFLALSLLFYALRYTSLDFGPIKEGMANPQTVQLFAYIKDHTPPDAVVVFIKARALALYTGHPSAVYFPAENKQDLWNYFASIKADYLIVNSVVIDGKNDLAYLNTFIQQFQPHFQQVYANSDFTVYKITRDPTSS